MLEGGTMKVFVSWSGRLSQQIAEELKKYLVDVFGDTLEIFLSADSEPGTKWQRVLDSELSEADAALLVLTAESCSRPWVLFEAGAISVGPDKKRVYPILFGIDALDSKSPLTMFQRVTFTERSFRGLIESLIVSAQCPDRKKAMAAAKRKWPGLDEVVTKLLTEFIAQKDGTVQEQHILNLSPHVVFEVLAQGDIATDIQLYMPSGGLKLGTIPDRLHAFVHDHIPWRYRDEHRRGGDICTTVSINKTRISTFVSFTDGNRVLIFDRVLGSSHTTVINRLFDVFGSVDFENRSLKKKIRNRSFFELVAKRVELIPGFAFEDNHNQTHSDEETVIMFGFNVWLEPQELEMGADSKGVVRVMDTAKWVEHPEVFTAKASRAIGSLVRSRPQA
jgi:hypothetical protein